MSSLPATLSSIISSEVWILQQVVVVVRDAAGKLAQRFQPHRLLQRFFGFLALRDIALVAEKVGDLPGVVANGADVQQVPEAAAVLAVIEQLRGHFARFAQSLGDFPHGLRAGVLALQEAAVASQHFFARIAGHAQEGVVGVEDGLLGRGIGDDDAHAAGIDALGQRDGIDQPPGRKRQAGHAALKTCARAHEAPPGRMVFTAAYMASM
jgi:hypothetical protein